MVSGKGRPGKRAAGRAPIAIDIIVEAGDWPEAERRRDGAWKRNAWPPEMLWMDKRMDERKKEVGR